MGNKKEETEDEYIDGMLKEYKTFCCGVDYIRKGRANLRCSKCDKDVTMEITYLVQLFTEEFKLVKNGK